MRIGASLWALVAIFVFSILIYSSWYYFPINVVNRGVGLNIPVFSDVIFEKSDSSWQDAHVVYIFKASDVYMKKFLFECAGAGFSVDNRDAISSFLEYSKYINDSDFGVDGSRFCAKTFVDGKESWDLVFVGNYIFCEYYLYDRR